MKELKYLFYDNANDINNKEIEINTFKFNNKTKVKDLYIELRNKFYSDYGYEVDYIIVDNIFNYQINFDNFDTPLNSILEHCHLDNIIIIYSVLPIGATGAYYNGYRLLIHSDEQIHRFLPHVHVECGSGDTRINLNTLEIMDKDIFNSKKDKKKVLSYLRNNQEKWIGYYKSIVVEGKDSNIKIEKII